MHAKEIVRKYEAEEAVFQHDVILINVNRRSFQPRPDRPAEADGSQRAARIAWSSTLRCPVHRSRTGCRHKSGVVKARSRTMFRERYQEG
jgi:hypothetical protein